MNNYASYLDPLYITKALRDNSNPFLLCLKASDIILFPYNTTVESLQTPPPTNLLLHYDHMLNVLNLLFTFINISYSSLYIEITDDPD